MRVLGLFFLLIMLKPTSEKRDTREGERDVGEKNKRKGKGREGYEIRYSMEGEGG